jgi:alcohol dehydrogenase class IV
MDAFVQVIEPYVSIKANAMVDMFCRDAIPRAVRYLPAAFCDGRDETARENMAWVSLLGGMSLANAKLGAAHGFAGPMGGMFHAPHGAICAAVMAGVMQVNIEALSQREPENPALARYAEIAGWMTGRSDARAMDGARWMKELCKELSIPTLSDMGIKREDFGAIIEKSQRSSSMKGNPIKLNVEELTKILELSL